jgi:hypothetical protein
MASQGTTGKGSTGYSGSRRRRGQGGFRIAGAAARPALVPLAARHGFAESEVLIRWREIAGEALAALCHPVKVAYGRGAALGATLMVRAEGPAALEVEHRAPQIIERINAHYGYRAISRITITQGTGLAGEARGLAEGQAAFQGPGDAARPAENPWRGEARPPAPATDAARARAAAMAEGIGDPRLREALTRLGAFVLSRPPRDGGVK